MKKFTKLLVTAVLTIISLNFFTGCAFTSNEVQIKKARIIYTVPKNVSAEKVKEALREAISVRTDDLKDIENFMPETLPEKPGHPVRKNIFGALNTLAAGNPQLEATQLDTSNAWYTVQGHESFGTPLNKTYVVYKGAIYPYKDGYKVYIYEFYEGADNGFMGHLIKNTVEKITGSKQPLLFIAQIANKFHEEISEAKIINMSPENIKGVKLNLLTKGY